MNNFWKERGAKAIPVWWTKSVKAFRQKNTSGVWYIGASGRKGQGIGVFGRKTEKSVFWVDGGRPWVRAKESGFYQPGFCKLFEHRGEGVKRCSQSSTWCETQERRAQGNHRRTALRTPDTGQRRQNMITQDPVFDGHLFCYQIPDTLRFSNGSPISSWSKRWERSS